MPTVAQYLSLVSPQHRSAPRFMAALASLLQPLVDQQQFLARLPNAYDLDDASGVQLDAVGLWVGETRFLKTPLGGVFLTFGDPALGWGRGRWKGPFDDTSGLNRLDDDSFRRLLRAKIAANNWDGTLSGAAAALAYIYSDPLTHVFVQDNQDETISFNVAGDPLSAVDLALLSGGYIPLKPAGVALAYINLSSVIGAPLFGFGLDNSSVAGFGKGAWGVSITATPVSATTGTQPGAGSTAPATVDVLAFGLGAATAQVAGLGIGVWTGLAPAVLGAATVLAAGDLTGTDGNGLAGQDGVLISGPGTTAAGATSSSDGTSTGTTSPVNTTDPGTGATTPAGSGTGTSSTGSDTPTGTGTTVSGGAGGAGTDPTTNPSGTSTTPTAPVSTTPTTTTPSTPTTPAEPGTTSPSSNALPFGLGDSPNAFAGFGTGIWTGTAAP